MPETGSRIPEPRGQNEPRIASSALPDTEQSLSAGYRADPETGGAGRFPAAAQASAGKLTPPAATDAGASLNGATDGRASGASPDGASDGGAPGASGASADGASDGGASDGGASGASGASADGASGGGAPGASGASLRRAGRGEEGRSRLFLWFKELATVVGVAVVLSFLIKTFLFRAFYIPSESMVNTLDVNDRIFVNLLVPEPFALQRGDVVVFKDTKGWLAPAEETPAGPFTWVQDGLMFVGLLPDDSEQHLVKRVIGLPGDRVVCCDAGGLLTVNGAPLAENYINAAEVPVAREFDVVVPDGKVWVMGDNRNHSADSRAHMESGGGFVDVADIEGEAAVIAWPLNRITSLDNHPDVFRNVPAPAGR